jgi:hypothetical protein
VRDVETRVFHKSGEPVRVHIQEGGGEIVLHFADMSGEGDVLAVEINPRRAPDSLDEWDSTKVRRTRGSVDLDAVRRFGRNYALYIEYARAAITWDREGSTTALRALRDVGRTRRGLNPDFLSPIATEYRAEVSAGNSQPLKTLAERHFVDVSTVSRWIRRCRELGLLD